MTFLGDVFTREDTLNLVLKQRKIKGFKHLRYISLQRVPFCRYLGGHPTISTNDRDEQRKIIKYNHLVANCIIFHNVFSLSRVLNDLQQEGYPLESGHVAALSPYLTQHINRFGRYELDLEKRPPDLVYDLWALEQ